MAADSVALLDPVAPERHLELPDEFYRSENANHRIELNAFSDRTSELSQSLLPRGTATSVQTADSTPQRSGLEPTWQEADKLTVCSSRSIRRMDPFL